MNEGFIVSFHDNVLANDGGLCFSGCNTHNNVMEENSGPTSGDSFFYNNYILNPASTNNAGGIVLQLAPHSGQTSWFFNNVITNGPLYEANEVMCADALGRRRGNMHHIQQYHGGWSGCVAAGRAADSRRILERKHLAGCHQSLQ